MKKTVSILVLVFAFTLTTQGQKKGVKKRAEKLLVQMTSELSLTKEQEEKILPILITQMEDRKMMKDKQKALKDSGNKPSKEERKAMKKERNQKQKAINKKMASILDEGQMQKYKLLQETMKKKKPKKEKQ